MTISNNSPAPKARNVKAWGNAPGGDHRTRIRALKARHEQLAPSYFALTALQYCHTGFPGALPQAFAFRAFGAFYLRSNQIIAYFIRPDAAC